MNLACGDQIAAARVLARMEPRVIQCLVTARVLLDTTGHSVTPGAITETMASIVLRNVDAKTVNIFLRQHHRSHIFVTGGVCDHVSGACQCDKGWRGAL